MTSVEEFKLSNILVPTVLYVLSEWSDTTSSDSIDDLSREVLNANAVSSITCLFSLSSSISLLSDLFI